MMTREEAVKHLTTWIYTDFENMPKQVLEALNIALAALRPISRERLDVVINSLKLRLENNEENGVVYLPKFAVEQMIERLEVLRDD